MHRQAPFFGAGRPRCVLSAENEREMPHQTAKPLRITASGFKTIIARPKIKPSLRWAGNLFSASLRICLRMNGVLHK